MSRYHEMLARAIAEKGLLLKEVVAQCERLAAKEGWAGPIKFDIATLSRLRDGKQAPPVEPAPGDPTPSKNRLLAKVLGIPEKQFVLAAALEHTPLAVLENIAVDVSHDIANLLNSTKVALNRARRVLKAVEEHPDTPAELSEQAHRAAIDLVGPQGKVFDAAIIAMWDSTPYVKLYPVEGNQAHKSVLENNKVFIRGHATHHMIETLASAAGIEHLPLMCFVSAMQQVAAIDDSAREFREKYPPLTPEQVKDLIDAKED